MYKRQGPGRLPEPDQIAEVVRTELAGYRVEHRWKGKKVVISAGGTREELDPVRYLGNRSSGRQGFALAEWACQMGADVTIVAGNTASLPVPSGAKVRSIISTRELEQAMREEARDADVVIMAAAVSDFRPAEVAESKMKKGQADDVLSTLHLVENPDVLKGLVAARDRAELPAECVIVGFAAETGDADKSALEYAQEKFARKGCDVIMANEVGRDKTFGQKSNEGWILRSGLEPQRVEHGSKQVVAAQILAAVNEMLRD